MVLSGGAGFENNAAVQTSALILKATGDGSNAIKGTAPLSIAKLDLSKTPGQAVVLQKNLSVGSSIFFSNGLVNLNGFTLTLGDTAYLDGENENSRIMSTSTGGIQVTQNLNSPLAENPGNLGLIITSGANWGNTTIRRGHTPFTNGGGGSSIARSYTVTPTNNTGLNAFLRVYYLDAELNGLNENALDFTQSGNGGASWNNLGSASRNTTLNFVNLNGVQQMTLFTLTPGNNPLPLQLVYINASCMHNRPQLQWKIADAADLSHFVVQKSRDSKTWEDLEGDIAIDPSTDHEYAVTDVTEPYPYYRLESVSTSSHVSYSQVQTVNCQGDDYRFRLLQNPVSTSLRIGTSAASRITTRVVIFDMLGRMMLSRDLAVAAGEADVEFNLDGFARGTYQVQVIFRNEAIWQTKFVKQ